MNYHHADTPGWLKAVSVVICGLVASKWDSLKFFLPGHILFMTMVRKYDSSQKEFTKLQLFICI